MQGYYRQPSVWKDRVVFVSEDDLWELKLGRQADGSLGGAARRLTRGRGAASDPMYSPDGTKLAYVSTEDGAPEVYVMDAGGGQARQLTFNGAMSTVAGWSPDGSHVLFRSNYRGAFRRSISLFEVPVGGGQARRLPVGQAHAIAFEPGGPGQVIARFSDDLARWKRYRGGTAGELWICRDTHDETDPVQDRWQRLRPQFKSGLDSAGLVRPMWIGGRIYFLSDEEGYANIYSCLPDGSALTRHTDHVGFYARFATTDGQAIVYTVGGTLWRFDVASGKTEPIACDDASPRTALARKFVDAEEFLDDFALHPEGHSLVVTTRGKLFNFGNWEGAVRQTGVEQGVRYRLAEYLSDGEHLVVLSDAGGEEHFEVHRVDGATAPLVIDTGDFEIGRPLDVRVSPVDDAIIFTNHRQELIHLDLASGDTRLLDHSEYDRMDGMDWSPDGRWVAYGFFNNHQTSQIRIYDLQEDQIHAVTSGDYRDIKPVFDPRGRYLYFLSYRKFNPVYDELFFELSFPNAMIPCVVTLRDDVESLFVETPRPLDAEEEDDEDADLGEEAEEKDVDRTAKGKGAQSGAPDASKSADEDAEIKPIDIDFAQIRHRVEIFPGPEGNYGDILATESRIFWTVYPVEGSLGGAQDSEQECGTLNYFSLEKRSAKAFARGVVDLTMSADRKTLALWTMDGLQVVSAAGEGPIHHDHDDDKPGRASGYVDLGRLSVRVEPRAEWGQMLRESWRLMREHFWRADMSGVDWDEVWERYSGLLDRVGSRTEFSDLVWTMQGELGTSHAYEYGGDYPRGPHHPPGFLGADLEWDADFEFTPPEVDPKPTRPRLQPRKGGYRILEIIAAETWDPVERSPLARPGIDVVPGDVIVAINGQPVDEKTSVEERLVNLAGQEVELVVVRPGSAGEVDSSAGAMRTITVKTLVSEAAARYRQWVFQNRKKVHQASGGQLGYVHIPDMGPEGYSEFHRAYVSENTRKGLVVDVRFNGGGHVSQLILEKLARRQVGYDIKRWGKPTPYPLESVIGPMVALTNEQAGSDGDIFSHSFKLMKLGPLLGKRTWGGVIGIWPRHALVDGSITTQPEFSFWFQDVGFGVENWGTEPDIEVELSPDASARGEDPQLDAAIAKAMELLAEQKPELPEFAPYPQMAPPQQLD